MFNRLKLLQGGVVGGVSDPHYSKKHGPVMAPGEAGSGRKWPSSGKQQVPTISHRVTATATNTRRYHSS